MTLDEPKEHRTFEEQYKYLIQEVRDYGRPIEASKGKALSIPFASIYLNAQEVPLITSRKMYPRGIIGELKAFLKNAKTNEDFVKEGCNFWGAWADKQIDYARLLHDFNGIDQLNRTVIGLIEKPHSRKHVISLWDPSSDTLQPPCVIHYQWQVLDGTLYMTWSQRSVDVMVGLASDMFSAWLWNQLMAKATGYQAGPVHMQLSAVHLYDVHNPEEYLTRKVLKPEAELELEFYSIYDWKASIKNYKHLDAIKYELCV